MRNDIINYATGEPETTIEAYYDNLIKEDGLKHVNRLNDLCFSLYRERGLAYKATDKTAVCKIFQEIADTISIPFQEVFDLWNDDRLLLYTKKRNLIFGGVSNNIYNKYINKTVITLVFIHERTKEVVITRFKITSLMELLEPNPTWNDFLNHIEAVRNKVLKHIDDRRARIYNTKMLSKYMFGLSNKDWKKVYNKTHVVHFKDNRNPLLERLSLILDVIPDYEIDKLLFMSLLEKFWPNLIENYTTAESSGRIVTYFAELIKAGKLRKHSTPFDK